MISSKEMGETIKRLRVKKGLSQTELAQAMGYKDRTTIAKLESGDNRLPESKIEKMATILGVTGDYLRNRFEEAIRCLDFEISYTLNRVYVYNEDGIEVSYDYDDWEILKRNNVIKHVIDDIDFVANSLPESKKAPDTFIDVEDLSEDKRYLVEKIMSLSDAEVRGLRAIVDQVLALRG